MNKIRIVLYITACLFATASAFASHNSVFALRAFIIDQNGFIVGPAAPVYSCPTSNLNCTQVWNVDANGTPTTPAGAIVKGTYTPL